MMGKGPGARAEGCVVACWKETVSYGQLAGERAAQLALQSAEAGYRFFDRVTQTGGVLFVKYLCVRRWKRGDGQWRMKGTSEAGR